MATKRLDMVFKNQLGTTNRFSVDSPRDDLLEADVQAAMGLIIAKNIFDTSGGDLVAVESAVVVTTDVTEVIA